VRKIDDIDIIATDFSTMLYQNRKGNHPSDSDPSPMIESCHFFGHYTETLKVQMQWKGSDKSMATIEFVDDHVTTMTWIGPAETIRQRIRRLLHLP
jgi:hypothetical protein